MGDKQHGRDQGTAVLSLLRAGSVMLCLNRGFDRIVFACVLVVVMMSGREFAQAQEQYLLDDGQWAIQGQPDPDSPHGRLQEVRRALAGDDPKTALTLVEAWIEQNPGHPSLDEAYLLRGNAKIALGEYYQALYDYEFVAREYPSSTHFDDALQRQFKIATAFASGLKRKFLGFRILSADGEAEEVFIRIQERAPGSAVGERASLALGDYYYDRELMSEALVGYELFLVNYPNSPHRRHVMQRMIEASLATFRSPRYDPTGLIEAAQRIKDYQSEFPDPAMRFNADAKLQEIDELLAKKVLYNGEWYQNQEQRVSAIYVYRRLLREYPHTPSARLAVARLSRMGVEPTARSTISSPSDTDHPPEVSPEVPPDISPEPAPEAPPDIPPDLPLDASSKVPADNPADNPPRPVPDLHPESSLDDPSTEPPPSN